ncbi:MAG: hypothetical protein J5I90_01335 [Caldilineales bacterium]|nr:hypothetical protein [Caldilineales bacterium]
MKTYTLMVTLPQVGKVSRSIEMASDQTLDDLHFAIQDAFEFDADHLYSFFMSGLAWDSETEYTIPEEKMDEMMFGMDEDEEEDDEEGEEEVDMEFEAMLQSPEERQEFMNALQNMSDDDANKLAQMMHDETGMPKFMTDMMVDFIKNLDQEEVEILLDPERYDELFGDDEEAEDSTIATLESLDLKVGSKFLYLFDYGDEWHFQVRVQKITKDADDDVEYPRLVAAVGEAPEQYPDWEDDDEEWDEDEDWEDDEEA